MAKQVELSRGPVVVLDTAGQACQAGVWVDGQARAMRRATMRHGQAEWLVPFVRDVVAEAGVAFDSIVAVVVTVGPGSFTGLRVGLAAAHGLSVAVSCPVAGVSSFAAWAMTARQAQANPIPIRVALDSRRGDAFVQDFATDGRPQSPARIVALAEIADFPQGCVVGDISRDDAAPDLMAVYAAACDPHHQRSPVPLYLRPADAALPGEKAASCR